MRIPIGLAVLAFVLAAIFRPVLAAESDGEAAAWEPIKTSQSADDLKAFLDSFPRGEFAAEARARYSRLADMKLPPLVQHMELRFPQEAKYLSLSIGAKRNVILDILVGVDGKAKDITFKRRSGFDPMDDAARAGARRAVYLPALDRGIPVAAHMDYEVHFTFYCNPATGDTSCEAHRFQRRPR